MKQTPLYAAHTSLNAKIVDFAGWAMPVLYTGILEEARAVRSHSGIFDISHMGRIIVSGDGATGFLQSLTSNDVEALKPSEAQYSLLTNKDGGIIDDIIVYRQTSSSYLVVINAGNTAKDLKWLRSSLSKNTNIADETEETAMIAVQGPEACSLVANLAGEPSLLDLKRFQYATGTLSGAKTTFCRTGYTGEDGFELIVPASRSEEIWNALLNSGAVACGLGARDALRIEAGYPLYGHEIDDASSPVEAGLMWAVKLGKGDFTGSEAIAACKRKGAARKLVGLRSEERIQPRQGYNIYVENVHAGVVTSGVFSPTLNTSVAMGYVASEFAINGSKVEIAIRDKRATAVIVPKKNLISKEKE